MTVKKTTKKPISKVQSKSHQIAQAWKAGFAYAADHEDELERYRESGVFPKIPVSARRKEIK